VSAERSRKPRLDCSSRDIREYPKRKFIVAIGVRQLLSSVGKFFFFCFVDFFSPHNTLQCHWHIKVSSETPHKRPPTIRDKKFRRENLIFYRFLSHRSLDGWGEVISLIGQFFFRAEWVGGKRQLAS
jgi:hypothetical protein